ncbi:MAG TPA: hypothetical protein VMW16_11535 [Sedimentisphaerales bacterium]|nr:hypothetical protein [Sedimentisphaerales bacterium]
MPDGTIIFGVYLLIQKRAVPRLRRASLTPRKGRDKPARRTAGKLVGCRSSLAKAAKSACGGQQVGIIHDFGGEVKEEVGLASESTENRKVFSQLGVLGTSRS